MSQSLETEVVLPDISHLVTEDDTPVDNFPSEKQQRLLTESLYSSWVGSGSFIAGANIGLFYGIYQPPIVPDVFLSLNVQVAEDWWERRNRSYFIWEFGKPPEVVIEIVSNTEGNELGSKLRIYEQIRVGYYVVYDPVQQLGPVLRVYELRGNTYVERAETWLEQVELGVTLWQGAFEGRQDTWLRWCDQQGNVIPTGAERAEQEHQRAEQEQERAKQEHQRAEQEHQRAEREQERAEQERQRAERFAEQLRALGVNPEDLS